MLSESESVSDHMHEYSVSEHEENTHLSLPVIDRFTFVSMNIFVLTKDQMNV